jgi:hypothetical protein
MLLVHTVQEMDEVAAERVTNVLLLLTAGLIMLALIKLDDFYGQ